ncbi:collagen alpha-1(X) chain-like isoform X1 [Mauremys mutica]|uniref:collagen alpha-1(X) chain-like isoform X1 n=1 Tax=Mauremys mutica TaxID=74926 RepID=UPI001D1629A6|nr:collagen alpha-1(X) chain-like isoform X1 [Mauremys mutica]
MRDLAPAGFTGGTGTKCSTGSDPQHHRQGERSSRRPRPPSPRGLPLLQKERTSPETEQGVQGYIHNLSPRRRREAAGCSAPGARPWCRGTHLCGAGRPGAAGQGGGPGRPGTRPVCNDQVSRGPVGQSPRGAGGTLPSPP